MFRILKIYWPLIILITLYTAYFSVTSILRYKYYYSGIFDLGHMTQVMWTTINGPFFTETDPAGTGLLVSRLTDHADFILILIAPIYAIFSSPEFLLILQSLIIALGAIPVFQFAKEKTESKFLPIFFACIYLLLPSVQNPNLADFHGVTLSMTFIAFAFYFLYKKKFKWGSVFVVLSLICKEQIGFTLSFMFLYFLFQNVKGKKIFISLKATFLEKKNENIFLMLGFILCLAYSFIMILVIIPNLRGSGSIYLNYYDGSGEGLGGILKTVIENPVNVVNSHYDGTVKYSGDLLFPVAGQSIF